MSRYKHEELTGQIINAAHTVHNKLGCGFLEKVYHNSLVIELRKRSLSVEPEKRIEVNYDGQTVGEYFGDIVVLQGRACGRGCCCQKRPFWAIKVVCWAF
jgi:hypothetical protein